MAGRTVGRAVLAFGYIMIFLPLLIYILSYWLTWLWHYQYICYYGWMVGIPFVIAGRYLIENAGSEPTARGPDRASGEVPSLDRPPRPVTGGGREVPSTPPPERGTATPPQGTPPPSSGVKRGRERIRCPKCETPPSEKDISASGRTRCPECGMIFYAR